jgi:hypothetical protein
MAPYLYFRARVRSCGVTSLEVMKALLAAMSHHVFDLLECLEVYGVPVGHAKFAL